MINVITTANYAVNGTYQPVAGDFDGNGYDDIFWYVPGSGAESLWAFRAGRTYTSRPRPAVNGTTYGPGAADYNRDGFADILWHVPGTGAESLWRGGATAFTTGGTTNTNGTYNLRPGDYTGDGFGDVYWFAGTVASLWRGSATTFASQAAPAMASTARPVAGDFTGDGRQDLFAYVPGAGVDRLIPGKATGL